MKSEESVNILEVTDLKKSYIEGDGKLEILKGVNLEVKRGELIAITGESGCGKSTLLHLLGLLDTYDSGFISYSGKKVSIKEKNVSKFRNHTIGFVFQSHYLLEDFSAQENAAMPNFIATGNLNSSIEKAQDLLELLDIIDRKDHYPNQLSGGEQQRVAVARALINNPEIVLADEPTGNLDPEHSEELIDLMVSLNKTSRQTFIIVTHDPKIAAKMDRCFVLKDGILLPALGN